MTQLRRFLALITIGVLAACTVDPLHSATTASPIATTTPSPAPTTPAPSPAGSPATPSECPATLAAGEPEAYLTDYRGLFDIGLTITAIASTVNPTVALDPPSNTREPQPVRMIGGQETSIDVDYTERSWQGQTRITSFRATLTIEGQAPLDLPMRSESRDGGSWVLVVVRAPDLDAVGQLAISVEWTDPCFVIVGTASTSVEIDSSASVVACSPDEDGAFDELHALFDPKRLRVGPEPIDMRLAEWLSTGKVTPLPIIDPLPPYVGFTTNTPVLAAGPGASIKVAYSNPEVDLQPTSAARVIYFRRGALLRWLEGGWIHGSEPEAKIVFESTLIEQADGTFRFEVPVEPARYAAQVVFRYDSSCSFGTAGFTIGIDVTAP